MGQKLDYSKSSNRELEKYRDDVERTYEQVKQRTVDMLDLLRKLEGDYSQIIDEMGKRNLL